MEISKVAVCENGTVSLATRNHGVPCASSRTSVEKSEYALYNWYYWLFTSMPYMEMSSE